MHMSVGNSLRAQLLEYEPRTLEEARRYMDKALVTAMHAIRINVSEATGNSLGGLAFHWDMLLNIPLQFNMEDLNNRRQLQVDRNTAQMNTKCYGFDYKVGERVMKKRHEHNKLDPYWDGPFEITQVHVNGNVPIEIQPGVVERLNIRRLKPYKEPTPNVLEAWE